MADVDDDSEDRLELTPEERAARRAEDLEAVVVPWVKETFAADATLRSAMFLVAQYWCDNANDQVHGMGIASREDLPRWPHVCSRELSADRCWRCRRRGYAHDISLPYDERSFRAWEGYCREYASQNDEPVAQYLPYAVFRRRGASELAMERIGDAVRPWFEMPGDGVPTTAPPIDPALLALVYADPDDLAARHVVADALLERGDPRGEHMAIALAASPSDDARARADALLAQHHRQWLGALARVVPWEGASFALGFPDRVTAFFPTDDVDLAWIADDPAWGTVRSLTFLPRSRDVVRPTMKNVRVLGPVREGGLLDIAASTVGYAVERLHIDPYDDAAFELLAEPDAAAPLPNLHTLVVSGAATRTEHLLPFLRSPLGKQVRALWLAPAFQYDATRPIDPAFLASWIDAAPAVELAFGAIAENGEPGGYWLHLRREGRGAVDAEITMPGLGTRFELSALLDTIQALPPRERERIARFTLRPSRWFVPTASDVAALHAATGFTASIAP